MATTLQPAASLARKVAIMFLHERPRKAGAEDGETPRDFLRKSTFEFEVADLGSVLQ
jgi:hypothetical protein